MADEVFKVGRFFGGEIKCGVDPLSHVLGRRWPVSALHLSPVGAGEACACRQGRSAVGEFDSVRLDGGSEGVIGPCSLAFFLHGGKYAHGLSE